MDKVKSIGLVAAAALAVLSSGCGAEDMTAAQMDALAQKATVGHAIEYREGAVKADGPTCEFVFISSDMEHRLNHYRICVADPGDAEKAAEQLLKAIQDCCYVCSNGFVEGSESSEVCKATCRGE